MNDQPSLSPEEIERYLRQKEYRRNYNRKYREANKSYYAEKQRERRTRIKLEKINLNDEN